MEALVNNTQGPANLLDSPVLQLQVDSISFLENLA